MTNDFLKECLSDINAKVKTQVPIDAFQKEYCAVCLNRECARAGVVQSSFFVRAQTWEQNLFLNPSSLSIEDPMVVRTQRIWSQPASVELNSPLPAHFQAAPTEIDPSEMPTPAAEAPPMDVKLPDNSKDNVKAVEKPVTQSIPAPVPSPSPKIINPFAPVGGTPKTIGPVDVIIGSGGSFTFGD